MKKLVTIVFICILLASCHTRREIISQPEPITSEQAPPAPAPAASTGTHGYISGNLGFPGEFIPPDLMVNAVNMQTNQVSSTTDKDKYDQSKKYILKVLAGKYQVYAATKEVPNYKAYYTQYVRCGLQVGCTSHAVITITVAGGDTVKNIDPQDWYINPDK